MVTNLTNSKTCAMYISAELKNDEGELTNVIFKCRGGENCLYRRTHSDDRPDDWTLAVAKIERGVYSDMVPGHVVSAYLEGHHRAERK